MRHFNSPPTSAVTPRLDPLVVRVREAALAMQRKDWEQGVMAQVFLEAGEGSRVAQLVRAALIYKGGEGTIATLGNSGGLIDCAMLGEALWRAAQATGEAALQEAEAHLRRYILERARRAPDGTLYHAAQQRWVDSFHCAPPYLAAVGEHDEAIRQVEGLRLYLWNAKARLYSHIWDDEAQRFENPAFWGVGNGWAAAGLTRVIGALPAHRQPDRERLTTYLRELLDGCLAFQRPDGLFHNVLDRPDSFVETNAAQMLAYAIYSGLRGGWLGPSYREAADRMRRAARAQVDALGFVQGVCGAPSFDAPGVAPEGQAFFLLMESAAERQAPEQP
ncbi:glycoside hydrolase family 88 protein [Deinococcus hopiensis]|uniref:Rhamnogalacturonyl hydrolase YesR n=1 Tax=Deinococcus hopiensis KR-140 TaxID=695939 RepID=A0A1W1UAX4_9DEIO|nr:glycoside hydrolase family 88 protein [Deinococcus hopiensis]SMB78235.1 Rhamnogalacturonyl hydrolase YesR [Deinococcus hopiensis KR-140]